jgi:hypothetical protein
LKASQIRPLCCHQPHQPPEAPQVRTGGRCSRCLLAQYVAPPCATPTLVAACAPPAPCRSLRRRQQQQRSAPAAVHAARRPQDSRHRAQAAPEQKGQPCTLLSLPCCALLPLVARCSWLLADRQAHCTACSSCRCCCYAPRSNPSRPPAHHSACHPARRPTSISTCATTGAGAWRGRRAGV